MEWEKQPDAAHGNTGNGGNAEFQPSADAVTGRPIGQEQVRELRRILDRYAAARQRTEQRIIASEEWWKGHNAMMETSGDGQHGGSKTQSTPGYKSQSAWLRNTVITKHADVMDAYPEASIRPRQIDDREEAKTLSSIVPVIMEYCGFEATYSAAAWQKLKQGTGAYKVSWDKTKTNGMGDISIDKVNLLNLYIEPGVEDVQKARYIFHTELVDDDILEGQFPGIKDRMAAAKTLETPTVRYDDTVDTTGKHTVVDAYYKRQAEGGKTTLHYVKFVENELLFASENEPAMAEAGYYAHGKYPYVLDPLLPIDGSPYGYGYIDLCKNPQTMIDMLNTAFVENAMVGAKPKILSRKGSINAHQLADTTQQIVEVDGSLDEHNLKVLDYKHLDGNYLTLADRAIQELRETSGNTETAQGIASHGVTAASGIAALQEASGKGSRDSSMTTYRAYNQIVYLVIELIRQYYDLPRYFRITGDYGAEQFIAYTNQGIQPQPQTAPDGSEMGYRVPEFDIIVSAQKKTAYNRVAQNELALQFYQLGFFNPQQVDQALACLEMMDFEGKDDVMQRISRNGTMFQKLVQYMQMALALAQKYQPELVQGLSQDIMQSTGAEMPAAAAMPAAGGEKKANFDDGKDEAAHMEKARAAANGASQPQQGGVV